MNSLLKNNPFPSFPREYARHPSQQGGNFQKDIPAHQAASGKPPKITGKDIAEIKPNYMVIAKRAASMIQPGDVVFITSATVGYFMAQNLPENLSG